jgi:hypothetical protein
MTKALFLGGRGMVDCGGGIFDRYFVGNKVSGMVVLGLRPRWGSQALRNCWNEG